MLNNAFLLLKFYVCCSICGGGCISSLPALRCNAHTYITQHNIVASYKYQIIIINRQIIMYVFSPASYTYYHQHCHHALQTLILHQQELYGVSTTLLLPSLASRNSQYMGYSSWQEVIRIGSDMFLQLHGCIWCSIFCVSNCTTTTKKMIQHYYDYYYQQVLLTSANYTVSKYSCQLLFINSFDHRD